MDCPPELPGRPALGRPSPVTGEPAWRGTHACRGPQPAPQGAPHDTASGATAPPSGSSRPTRSAPPSQEAQRLWPRPPQRGIGWNLRTQPIRVEEGEAGAFRAGPRAQLLAPPEGTWRRSGVSLVLGVGPGAGQTSLLLSLSRGLPSPTATPPQFPRCAPAPPSRTTAAHEPLPSRPLPFRLA